MSDVCAYLLGLATLPALVAVVALAIKTFAPDGFIKRECGACGWTQQDRVPFVRWIRWSMHRIHGSLQGWHRQSFAILLLEYGRDPISKKRLSEDFRVTGSGETSLTNMWLIGEGRGR